MAAALVGLAVWLVAESYLPKAAVEGSLVVVAARPVAAGAVLVAADVRQAPWPDSLLPAHAETSTAAVVGRAVAAAVDTGEVLTAARIRGPGILLSAPQGQVAAHVLLTDPASAAMVSAGDHVDLLAVATGQLLARDVTVLAVDGVAGPGGSGGSGPGLWNNAGQESPPGLVVSVDGDQAAALARAGSPDTGVGGVHVVLRRPVS